MHRRYEQSERLGPIPGTDRGLLRATSDALLDPQVLLEAVRDSQGRIVDFVYRELNQATCDYLEMSREELLGRGLMETTPGIAEVGLFAKYTRCLDTGEPVIVDDLVYDNEILGEIRRYDVRATRVTPNSISLTWRDVTDRFEAAELLARVRDQQHKADLRYRRLVDNSGIGMALLAPGGLFEEVNPAICDFFGYDSDTLRTKTLQELTAPDFLHADTDKLRAVVAGDIESYRMEKQYIHADGRLHWGDLSVSCLRNPEGRLESLIVQIVDITAEVEARHQLAERNEENRELAERLQAQTDRLTAELHSAAAYVASILPGDLEGPVRVSARYLPARELAGDSYDYRWIDDDHLIAYLLDVSGHGVGPALLSVSVHNMMRSGSVSPSTLLAPEQVLAQLNRSFQMEQHDGRYLTMWYCVYEASSRTLRYASAAAPPAFAVLPGAGGSATELSTAGQPLGMFTDTTYTAGSYSVPPGCRLLIYSDGAYEHSLDTGRPDQQLSLPEFNKMFTRMAASSLDDLTQKLRELNPSGSFDDDCSLVKLDFS